MSATASRKRAKRGRVPFQSEEELWTLVLGDRHRQKIQDLVSVLEKYFARVEVTPNPLLSGGLSSHQNPAMVVVTDVMKTGTDMILEMRRELPEAGDQLVPVEVKLSATPRPTFAKVIKIFRNDLGPRALPGYVVHPGDIRLSLGSDVTALPFAEV